MRPIAISETWYRFVGAGALRTYGHGIRASLAPLQVGVGTPRRLWRTRLRRRLLRTLRRWSSQWTGRTHSIAFTGLRCLQQCSSLHRLCCQWCSERTEKKFPCTSWGSQRTLLRSCGVRQGDPLGPLLFALTLQPVLERVDAACEEALLVSYLDDMNIVGKLIPAAGSFRRVCVADDEVRSIGLEPQLPKCGIYGGDKGPIAAEAAKLPITHQLNGFATVGTPLGSAEYVSNALGRRAAMAQTLVQLPLSVQSQLLLLRASL